MARAQKEVAPFYGKHNSRKQLLGPQVGAVVATIEKANMLVNRLLEDGTVEQLGAVVVDELHMVGEDERGATLELMLSKLCYWSLRKERAPEVPGPSSSLLVHRRFLPSELAHCPGQYMNAHAIQTVALLSLRRASSWWE